VYGARAEPPGGVGPGAPVIKQQSLYDILLNVAIFADVT